MDHPFRSAAFGGFNRQDVLDYLEKTAAENARKKQELQQRLEEAEEDRRKLASQESDQEERVTILNRDRESLSQQLEQVKAVLEASREREEAQSRELEELRRERDSLRRRVAELEPGAAAYTAVKERAAGVELEAHCRAQNVLNEADGQARELRRGMEQWLGRVQVEYDALRSEVESTVSHAADQLEKAGKCLEQVTALLADQDVALEELSRAYDSTDREKVPAPMPLTGFRRRRGPVAFCGVTAAHGQNSVQNGHEVGRTFSGFWWKAPLTNCGGCFTIEQNPQPSSVRKGRGSMKKQSCGHNAYSCASAAGMTAAVSSCANFQAKSGSASASVSLLDTMMMVSFFVVLVGIVGLLADSLLLVNVLSVLCVAGLLIILALEGRSTVPKR